VSELGSAIDELALEDLAATPQAVLGNDLVEIRRAIDRLEAEWLRRLAVFDRRGVGDEVLSTQCWVRRHCGLTPGAARERVSVARRLGELPETQAAFAAGEIGYAHVRQISAATRDVDSEVMAQGEPILVEAARNLDARRLGTVIAHWHHTVDPGAFIVAANESHERRRFDISETFEGMTVFDGEAYGDVALVRTAIDAYSKPLPGDMRTPRSGAPTRSWRCRARPSTAATRLAVAANVHTSTCTCSWRRSRSEQARRRPTSTGAA
jgi:Domain of unknown function (DUF222)